MPQYPLRGWIRGPAAAWSNLGMMLRIEGRFDDALAAYDRAIGRCRGRPADQGQSRDNAVGMPTGGKRAGEAIELASRPTRLRRHFSCSDASGYSTPMHAWTVSTCWSGTRKGSATRCNSPAICRCWRRLGATVTASVPLRLVRLLRGIPRTTVIQGPGVTDRCRRTTYKVLVLQSRRERSGTTTRNVPATPWLAADPALASSVGCSFATGGVTGGVGLGRACAAVVARFQLGRSPP